MKGIFPSWFRIAGYALLLLSVFIPLLMYLFGAVDDGNLLYVKLGMKFVIWISLFGIFFSKSKEENETSANLRIKAVKVAFALWAIYYIIMLIRDGVHGNVHAADNSCGIAFMIINVICMEFFFQKHKAEQLFKRK